MTASKRIEVTDVDNMADLLADHCAFEGFEVVDPMEDMRTDGRFFDVTDAAGRVYTVLVTQIECADA